MAPAVAALMIWTETKYLIFLMSWLDTVALARFHIAQAKSELERILRSSSLLLGGSVDSGLLRLMK
jgi:hypothetical protein